MNHNMNIHTFIGCDSEYGESKIVIFGAPFDSTTSYRPGARFASSAMRNESYGIETYSPRQDKDLTDTKIYDGGDLELCFGSPELALYDIECMVRDVLENEKLPIMIGGEHLVTLGAVRAAVKKYSDLHIVHFDAHADLRNDYLGQKLSHACVMKRCHELVGDRKIFQYGIRSGDREEFEWGKKHVSTSRFNFEGLDRLKEKIGDKPVYFTLDLDVLDPSCFCGTGTPEAGGVSYNQLIKAIELVKELNVVALDINELSPMLDQSGASTALACKLLREIMLYFYKEN